MRVLFLCHRQHDVSIGGVAEFLHYLPLALAEFDINSFVYTQAESQNSEAITLKNGIPCFSGPFLKPSWFSSKQKLLPLLKLCQSEKIDIIHAQGLYRSGYIAMQIKKYLNIPYVITSHSDILGTNSERIKRGSVQRRCRRILKNAEAVTHLTPLMEDASHAIYDTRNKSKIIGNGIDLATWRDYKNLPEKNYLFAIGRLEPEKGFHVLLDAYAQLRKKGIKTSFVIAGTGSAESALHTHAKTLGLNLITRLNDFSHIPEDSVVFTGYVRGEIKNQLMAESQLVLFATQPTKWEEPFGIVQIEAMAAGKPLVSSDIAATRYLQKYGLQASLVPPSNVLAWTKEISDLLNDAVLRKKLGRINLENAKQFDWKIIGKKYFEVYEKLQSR